MEFIDLANEQSTAITDALLALIALASLVYLRQNLTTQKWKLQIWVGLFGVLTFASSLGAVVHGFKIPFELQTNLWHLLNFSLALLVSLFAIASTNDIFSEKTSRRVLPFVLFIALIFFVSTLFWPDSFNIFIIYQLTIMLYSLSGYFWLAYTDKLKGSVYMTLGILITITASFIQTTELSVTLIWLFDHNGIYHLIQILGVISLVIGIKRGLG
ncbi:hypothetical protein THMIRHAM_06980 [Thiomicrorhabdus immobilis]|uniref:Uncharacterized protein n=1 Tax=Thiomicrorhabdus immobilis TaxID=2791037 RepID=A0ABM7MBZ8_9GAMM|nr:hypothetical protein [Thiomicrorhabdus immobilis]BCN92913.1 hypothetical protein THMIRHAM_06980 [Thiomicrorhabdus immobilis]